ncbi:MAG TPA: helix-hairpin-helix domain-containing protein [Verrucomicrobiae bacterium]|nr:helix-hairpin-helix domain-containing protein [Verrucomicrobiae bacterium]
MFPTNGFQPGHGFLRAVYRGMWLGLFIWIGVSGYAQVRREGGNQEAKWEVLSGCRLVTNQVVDGDSFHVLHKGREYIFRLYFVDSPETDPALKDRVKEQATFFGISTNDLPRAGALASRFTREKLAGKDITVITRWQNAMGRSSLARYYAVLLVNGVNLAEELVANGLARIHGPRANWPDGPRSTVFASRLKNLELAAREKKLGVWNQSAFPLETDAPIAGAATNRSTRSATSPVLIDVNTATFEELLKLPGIGAKLAEQIIAHRPYQTLKDLDVVPGIGPTKLEQLRPLVRVDQLPSGAGKSK